MSLIHSDKKEFIFSDTLVPGIDRFSVILSDITIQLVNRDVVSHQTLPYNIIVIYDHWSIRKVGFKKSKHRFFIAFMDLAAIENGVSFLSQIAILIGRTLNLRFFFFENYDS